MRFGVAAPDAYEGALPLPPKAEEPPEKPRATGPLADIGYAAIERGVKHLVDGACLSVLSQPSALALVELGKFELALGQGLVDAARDREPDPPTICRSES